MEDGPARHGDSFTSSISKGGNVVGSPKPADGVAGSSVSSSSLFSSTCLGNFSATWATSSHFSFSWTIFCARTFCRSFYAPSSSRLSQLLFLVFLLTASPSSLFSSSPFPALLPSAAAVPNVVPVYSAAIPCTNFAQFASCKSFAIALINSRKLIAAPTIIPSYHYHHNIDFYIKKTTIINVYFVRLFSAGRLAKPAPGSCKLL